MVSNGCLFSKKKDISVLWLSDVDSQTKWFTKTYELNNEAMSALLNKKETL